jgi:hypothetical protein
MLDEAQRAQMAHQARSTAEALSWPAMMDEVLDHYRRLIVAHAHGRPHTRA